MRTCIYARKSTHKLGQKETIENQIKICKRYAHDNSLEIVDIKQDAATGTDDISRPEVKKLIDGAIGGLYECVIMKGISRLYRDTEKGLGLIKLLDRHGIRVITVEEMFDSGNPDSRTGTGKLDLSRITMYLMFSEMESKKLADRIKYTQIEKALNGEWNHASNTPFGYKFNPETKKLDIDYATSPIVTLIFNLYEKGLGMRTIQNYLNGANDENKKYSAPSSDRWNQYTIGFILKNEAYKGSVVYNKRSKKERPYKNPESLGKGRDDIYIGNDYNDRSEWIIKENAHEPIIEETQFDKIQMILSTKSMRKGIRSNVSLLAGIAKCGECGCSMTFHRGRKDANGWVKSKDNYYCLQYIKYGKNYCGSHHVGAKDLEELLIENLATLCKNPQLIEEMFEKRKNSVSGNKDKYHKEKSKIEIDIRKLSEKMDKLFEKNMNGDINDQQYKMMNEKYSNDLSSLSEQLIDLELKITHDNEGEQSKKDFMGKIKEIVDIRLLPKEEQRYLLLSLVKEVVVNKELKIKIVYKFEA